jgi:hypothetical protein
LLRFTVPEGEEVQFAADSPVEGAVHCELVSESEDPEVKFVPGGGFWMIPGS